MSKATTVLLLTPELCRAARALLGMGQRELAAKAGVAHKTLADFERGVRSPYGRTLKDLLEALQDAGIYFSEEHQGVRGPSIALKWGVKLPQKRSSANEGEGTVDPTLEALWNGNMLDVAASSREGEELRAHWRERPEQWAALHQSSRHVMLQMMGLERTSNA